VGAIAIVFRARSTKVESFQIRERAQGLVEYGLIIALVAVLAIAGLIIFGPAVSALLSKLGGSV
jgi:Flp pilus assembly pilin Flp